MENAEKISPTTIMVCAHKGDRTPIGQSAPLQIVRLCAGVVMQWMHVQAACGKNILFDYEG